MRVMATSHHPEACPEGVMATDLGSVMEVPELCLPEHEGVGVAHREADLKAQHCKLGQGAVAHGVLGLASVQVPQRAARRDMGGWGGGRGGGREAH